MARSALGLTKDNKLLMVTVSQCENRGPSKIMQKLGAYNAMNIDGGASSGLYTKGNCSQLLAEILATHWW